MSSGALLDLAIENILPNAVQLSRADWNEVKQTLTNQELLHGVTISQPYWASSAYRPANYRQLARSLR